MSVKFKNKIRGKPLDHVVSLCQAVVLGKVAKTDSRGIDVQCPEAPAFPVEIDHIKVTKVIYQTPETPAIPVGEEIPVFPASLPKQVDQWKQYYQNNLKKSCIFESYTCDDEKAGERYYFINFTCFGWCYVCRNASEGKSLQEEILAHTRAAFPDYRG